MLWDPLGLLSNGYQGIFTQGVKQPQHEANHSLPFSAKIFKVWCLIEQRMQLQGMVTNRGNLNFTLPHSSNKIERKQKNKAVSFNNR
jgi:hypothetical protein